MRNIGNESKNYIGELKKRKDKGGSRISKNYQHIGLQIAKLLEDEGHKSLYIKLAKERDPGRLLEVAKDVATRENINNKGAYFMKIISK